MPDNHSFGENIFKEVNKKADIVKVVSTFLGYNNLQKKGKIYYALCPFHKDTNPSMQVNPERNTFHCWACDSKGNSIDFVKKYKNVKPIEALKIVSDICSIPLPRDFSGDKFVSRMEKEYPKELKALVDADKFYHLVLESKSGIPGKEYLAKRGLSDEVVSHFGIGYAPDDPKMIVDSLRKQGYDVDTLSRAGILSNSAALEDRFSHRIMFPIYDNSGHLVAFSGRILSKDQSPSKYINYPETGLFKKNEILYHFYNAKEDAKRKGYIYLVEGFMDVIAIVRAGLYAVCGTMGTALTQEHINALKSLSVEVRLCLDSDEPGQLGEERAAEALLKNHVPFRIVRKFKTGKDADEVLTNGKENGAEMLLSQLNRLYDPFLFFLRRTLGDRNMMSDPTEIQKFLKDRYPYYMALDDISKARDVELLSRVCSLDKATLANFLKNMTPTLKHDNAVSSLPYQNEQRPSSKTNYSSFRQRKATNVQNNIRCTWSGKYQLSEILLSLTEMAKNSPEAQGYLPQLIENECSIAVVLTHSFDAFMELQNSRTDLVFEPLSKLVNFIGDEYLRHPGNKEPFKEMDYQAICEEISSHSGSSTEQADKDDPLHLFSDEDAANDFYHNLSESESEFLLGFIEKIKLLSDDCFDMETLKSNLVLHPLYVSYDQLEKKKNLSGSLTSSEEIELIQLKAKIRKSSGKI